jgi:hypothetical protein
MSAIRSRSIFTVVTLSCVYATTIAAQGLDGQASPPVPMFPSTSQGGTGATAPTPLPPANQSFTMAPALPPSATAPTPPPANNGAVVAVASPSPAPAAIAPLTPTTAVKEETPERYPSRSGTLGFGTSLSTGTASFPLSIGNQLNLRIWLGDVVALQPALVSTSDYVDSTKVTTYRVNPQLEALFAIYRGKSNRINLGVGVGIDLAGVSKPATASTTTTGTGGTSGVGTTTTTSSDATKTEVYMPFELQLEQFLAPWFSLQVGASCELLHYTTATSGTVSSYSVMSETTSTKLQLGMMFYTY